MKKRLLQLFCLILTILITFKSLNVQLFAEELEDNAIDSENIVFHYDDLIPLEAIEIDSIAPSEIVYDLDDIGEQVELIRKEYANDTGEELDVEKAFEKTVDSKVYDNEWDRYSNNYVYNKLDDKKKLVWEAMDALCLEALETKKSYSDNIGYVSSSAFSSVNELADFISMYKYSNPQYYFLSNRWYLSSSGNTHRVGWCLYDNMRNGALRYEATAKFKKEIESFKNEINLSGNEYEIVKNVSEFICNNVEYNWDAVYSGHLNEQSEYTQSAYSTFILKNTVCAGYALATELLLNDAGVDCMGVTSPGHAYNKVKVYDSWYNLDTTNMDQVSYIYYGYFLKSSAALSTTGMHNEEACWNNYKPQCTLDSGSSSMGPKAVRAPILKTANPYIIPSKQSNGYSVTISCATPGASIYYTLNGERPSSSFTRSNLYTGPFNVSDINSVQAKAVCNEYLDSDIVTYTDEPVDVTVYYNANGGACLETKGVQTTGTHYKNLPIPTRIGYEFDGWYTDIYDGEKIDVDTFVTIPVDHTLYARWIEKENYVTFVTNGGTVSPDRIRTHFGEAYGELPIPQKALCDFEGWYLEETFDTLVTDDTIVDVDESYNLYAKWSYKYTVSMPTTNIENGSEVIKGTEIKLFSDTKGATIYFTTSYAGIYDILNHYEDNIYTGSIVITEPTTIWAIATKENYNDSSILEISYVTKDESDDWGDVTVEDRIEKMYTNANAIPDDLWVAGIPKSVDYNGKANVFDGLHIYNHKKLLSANTDYSVKYSNNVNAGTASITITGKGNYAGNIQETFKINELPLNTEKVKAADITFICNGRSQYGTTTVLYEIEEGNYIELKKGKDFDYVYSSDCVIGQHIVEIKGKGNYCDSTFFIENIINNEEGKLVSKLKFGKIQIQTATGEEIMPPVDIFDGDKQLTEGSEYELEYLNNVYPGTASVIVKGLGGYTGAKLLTFKINAISISKAIVYNLINPTYTGMPEEPKVNLLYKNPESNTFETLDEGVDYIVDRYEKNVDAGKNKAIVYVRGVGRFTGTLKKNFSIEPAKLTESGYYDGMNIGTYEIVKGGVKPDITLEINGYKLNEGKDYTVSYVNNKLIDEANGNKIPTMTIKGKGNYAGTINLKYNIKPSSINVGRIDVADIVYSNKAGTCKPKYTVYDKDGVKLVAGKDYDKLYELCYAEDTFIKRIIDKRLKLTQDAVAYENEPVDVNNDIIPSGTIIRLTVYGKGDYQGDSIDEPDKLSAEFRYVDVDLSKSNVTVLVPQSFVGTGIEVKPQKKDIKVTVKNKGTTVILKNSEYDIINYSNNLNKGNGKLTIKGLGIYGGTKTVTYKINTRNIFNWFGLLD